MQWRSIVVGLVVLRLSVNWVLWLAFGLGLDVSSGFNFHLGFNLHKLDLLFREEKGADSITNAWSQRIQGHKYEETASACAKIGEDSPRRSYMNLFDGNRDEYVRRYSSFPDSLRAKMKDMAKEMFYFGYENYMTYAFPEDELNPIDCEGRGPDVLNPSNININDVLGNYSLTLVDTLDTLLVLGNVTEFQRAVRLVIDTVSFDKDSTVQVFEANIRYKCHLRFVQKLSSLWSILSFSLTAV
ncbi:hypothetical protein XENORESO_017436 [Xenotaenia resolanae]|uniref:alpha-1,2-Mannosidase n=1 Tax=Xenotaenia resolanae TaxID=208358 RepID=A0ABV0X0X5_9TELE